MRPAVRPALSVAVALFAGYALAFLLSPDPTGATPVLAGLALAGLLSPVVYYGTRGA